jgi:O-antigen/teichoic acid export membrane protein
MGSVVRQSLVLFVSNCLMVVGGYGFKIYLARRLGAEALGLFNLGETVISFVLLAVMWELHQAATRFVPEYQARKDVGRLGRFIWASVCHVTVLGVLGGVGLYALRWPVALRLFRAAPLAGVLAFFALLTPLRGLATITRQIARSYKEVLRVVTIETFVGFTAKVILTVVLIALGMGLNGWLWAEVLTTALTVVLFGALALKLSPRAARVPRPAMVQEGPVYVYVAAMMGVSLLSVANTRISSILLARYVDLKAVGIYALAATGAVLMTMLQSALNGVAAPHFAELAARREFGHLSDIYYRVTRWDLMATLPLFVVYIVLADPLMGIFGSEFRAGAPVISALAVGQLINIGTGPVGTLLQMSGHERAVVWAMAGQLAVAAIGMAVLLPRWGMLGAAVATATTQALSYAAYYVYARRHYPLRIFDGAMLRLLASALLLFPLAWALLRGLAARVSPAVVILAALFSLYAVWTTFVYFALLDRHDHEFLAHALSTIRDRFRRERR